MLIDHSTNAVRIKGCDGSLRINLERVASTISIMSGELRIYRTYAAFVKLALFCSGVCPVTIEGNIVYRCLSLLWIFPCFMTLCSIAYFCVRNANNLKLLIAAVSALITMLNSVVKACCFSVHQKKLRQANDILESMLEEALKETNANSVAFTTLRAFYRLIYAQTFFMTLTMLAYTMKPLIMLTFYGSKNATDAQYPLPTLAAYPWAIDSTLLWTVHYVLESSACLFALLISTGVDAFFGFCMFRMSALLRLLAIEFATKFSGTRGDDENCRETLQECVCKHVLLIKCRDIVQNVYGPAILVVTVTNAVCMCSLIFQLMKLQVSKASIGKAVTFVVYFFMKLLQTFLYAWPGDVIISESEFLRREVYASGWYECNDTRFAKQFLMALIQRPIILKACDLLDVSLDLFGKVLNTTVSYYFLLETMEGDKK